MKKNSVFFNVAISFLGFYTLYTVAFFSIQVAGGYTTEMRRLLLSTSNQLKVGRALLRQSEIEDLDERLALAMEDNQFHFYSIRKSGVDVAYGNMAGSDDAIYIPSGGPEASYDTETYHYSTVQEGEYQLAIGYKTSWWSYFFHYWKFSRDVVLKDLGIVFLGVLVVVLYSFRDMRSVIRNIKRRGAKRGDLKLAKSRETLTLVRGLGGFESQAQELAKQKELFRTQVLGALRKELESGRTPPYEFDCTLVRSDINNFTQIFSSPKRAEFMEVINEFFIGVTHIVSRYGGSIHEFVGDEVLFYFKDDEHPNSSATAIAALRDINKLALDISSRTEAEESGYAFRIKSSLSHGTLRFGPLVDAYALAGPPLIESVRMLSHVHEKSENTVLFNESMTDATSDLCRSKRQQVVMLKGLQGARTLVTVEAFTPLSLHLRQADERGFKMATYYRDDQDICQVLDYVSKMQSTLDPKELNKLILNFRAFSVAKSSAEIKRAYIACFNQVLRSAHDNEPQSFLLASLVSAANHILTAKEWSGEVREILFECLKHSNRRVVANALDVFSSFEADAADRIFTELAKLGDNRIVANILVKDGKRDWNRKVARKLKAMLKGPSPYSKASGLYALGEIAKFVREQDTVAFAADADLQSLFELATDLHSHANAMVSRQAAQAIKKFGASVPEPTVAPTVALLRRQA